MCGQRKLSVGGDGGESNSPSRTLRQGPLRACPMICRQPTRRPSAGSRPVQSRVPRSGFERRYAAIAPFASSLNDASTAHEEEAASTLTLLPKQRGREQAGGCQLLRFVAFLRGQSDILGSRSLVAGPCRIHASPRPPGLRPTDADHATPSPPCQAGPRGRPRRGRSCPGDGRPCPGPWPASFVPPHSAT